jgi:hypothetical protein
MENNDSNLLAFEVEIHSMRCIVFARTAPKARWIAVRGYWEAYGRGKGGWPRPIARRISRLDNSSLKDHPSRCWAPEYVEDYLT